MRNKPRRIILNCGAALLCSTFVCYLHSVLISPAGRYLSLVKPGTVSSIDFMIQCLNRFRSTPLSLYPATSHLVPHFSLHQPSEPSLARSIPSPAPGLVRHYHRRPGSTDRPLPGALTVPTFPGRGAGVATSGESSSLAIRSGTTKPSSGCPDLVDGTGAAPGLPPPGTVPFPATLSVLFPEASGTGPLPG